MLRLLLHEFCGFIFLLMLNSNHAHVSLTFPPARYPSLDFLDNARTKGPCGIGKPAVGKGNPTTLLSGSTFNVTWTLTYPHQGGFRIELLDDKDQPRYALTPENVQFVGQEDQTLQTYQVTLPSDFECQNCGIRLLREAGEWGEYQFWSCADVNILREPKDLCQGHGTYKDGQCQCERFYSGEACQTKDECWADQDCGVNGKCEELKTFSFPRRVCYCKQGWFGPQCNSPSPLQNTSFDVSQYQSQEFGADKNKMFWRILKEKNEVEIVLQYPSTSWIAIGWRPENIPESCANLERLLSRPSIVTPAAAVPNPSAEPQPTQESPTLPNLPPYTTNETFPVAPFFPQLPNVTETVLENGSGIERPVQQPSTIHITSETPVVSGESSANGTNPLPPATESNNTQVDEGAFVTGFPGIGPGPAFTGTPVPFPPPYSSGNGTGGAKSAADESDVIGELCYGDWRFPHDCNEGCDMRASWTYIEDADEIEFSIEAKTPPNTWTALGFSATGTMNDADMIVVKSLQNKISILDMFTNGHAPPAKDPQQNVTVGPVAGTHVNGVLRTSFRRPRRSSDTHDVSFTDNECYYFLLSSGTLNLDGSMNKHSVKPKVSKKKVCIGSCNPSPLGTNSGEKYVTCDREFKFPSGCKPPACDYVANWTYIAQTQEVQFQISSREIGRWTGIGFSREGNMTNSDMVIGWVYENGTFLTDRFAYSHQQPAIDKQQDLKEVHGIIEDDIQTITFTRKLVTNDPEDMSLKECLYYLFPVGGGRVLARTAKDFQDKTTPLGFHDQTLPKISRDLICICNDEGIPVNITSNRLRRQAPPASEEEEEEPQVQTQAPTRRVPGLPQGQSVNITLGARPIPVFDPQSFEESLLTATPPARTAGTAAGASTAAKGTVPRGTTPVPESASVSEEEEDEEPVLTTDSLLRLQSAIVSLNSTTTPVPSAEESEETSEEVPATPLTPAVKAAATSAKPATNGAVATKAQSPPAVKTVTQPRPPVNESESESESASAESAASAEPSPASFASSPVPEPASGTSVAEPGPKAQPNPAPEPEPKPHGEPAPGAVNLHPMDCVDMIIGSAIGQYSRIGDYYSISRATPKLDTYYGGNQDLTAATGFEENGITTIAFRRRLTSFDPFDHNITLGDAMFIVWAKGQEAGSYSHSAPSGLEHGNASVKQFYTPDVLAYHGSKNRGSFVLSFGGKLTSPAPIPTTAVAGCKQDFLYPAGCKGDACHYNVTWFKYGGDVEFTIEAKIANNHWTGIAFSKDGLMAKSDAVIITAETTGAPEVTDRYISGYDAPREDKKQNIFNIESSYVNGRLKARFSRPLLTDDAEEDVDLNQCVYFLYPYNGGAVSEHGVQKHSATPLRSTEQICLNKCQINVVTNAGDAKTPAYTKKPPELATAVPVVDRGRKFSVTARILNEQWSDGLAVPGSPEHEALSAKLIKEVDNLLRPKFAGYDKSRVVKFTSGSVIAELELQATGLNSVQIREAIVPQATAGPIDGLQIDPESVRVKEVQAGLSPEEIRNYIIIAVACFLVMVATAFAVCMIVRTRRRRSKEMKSNWNLVPFTPYAYLMPPSGTYPAAYQYPTMGPTGGMDPKKGAPYHEGPLAQGYSADYAATGSRQLGTHHRQYSNATTATPINGKTPSPINEKSGGRSASAASSKNGNGETTYAEWFQRINSNAQPPAPTRGQQPAAGAYVQYPNDPYSFYTLGGSQRPAPFMQNMPPRQAPPPGYYRPY